jgi:NADPH:quinone reductase
MSLEARRPNTMTTRSSLPTTMKAVAIDRFGDERVLKVRDVPVPPLEAGEVLMRVRWAGLGEWDPFEREGGFAKLKKPSFPLVLGSEGAGEVIAVGPRVRRFKRGDRVFAPGFLNPKGGFYAEYAVVNQDLVAHVPDGVTLKDAAVMSGVGLTALRGLDDVLKLQRGESILIFGASGALGHLAVQIAQRRGARVLAIASGRDGASLVRRLGADSVVEGHKGDLAKAATDFAPDGVDVALFAGSGPRVKEAVRFIRRGGRLAFPNGIEPEPKPPAGVKAKAFDGDPDADIIGRFARLLRKPPLRAHIGAVFPLRRVVAAHRALGRHHIGKLALRIA